MPLNKRRKFYLKDIYRDGKRRQRSPKINLLKYLLSILKDIFFEDSPGATKQFLYMFRQMAIEISKKPIFTAFIFMVIILFIVLQAIISIKPEAKGLSSNIIAEGFGIAFDIFLFGIILAFFNKLEEKRRDIKRWKEEIDDFRFWNSEEAKFRIAGSIKRLNKAKLSNLDLSHCYLKKAILLEANLTDSNLMETNLEGVILWGAYLVRADLGKANLKDGNFGAAFLMEANLMAANLEGANFMGAILLGANLEMANLERANFMGANLRDANLELANLMKANLRGVILEEAILIGANLKKVINLSLDQLSKVKTLYKAKLDPELEAQVKEKFPHLLEKPQGRLPYDRLGAYRG